MNNSKVLNEICSKYSKGILHLVTTNSRTPEDARDVFQEAVRKNAQLANELALNRAIEPIRLRQKNY